MRWAPGAKPTLLLLLLLLLQVTACVRATNAQGAALSKVRTT